MQHLLKVRQVRLVYLRRVASLLQLASLALQIRLEAPRKAALRKAVGLRITVVHLLLRLRLVYPQQVVSRLPLASRVLPIRPEAQ